MHTCAYVNHTLMISPQFRTLEMTPWPSLVLYSCTPWWWASETQNT